MLLESFGFSQSLIDEITSFLSTSSDDLGSSTPTNVGTRSFGAAPASLGCASDASLAQQHVKAAIVDMVNGLQGYVDALKLLETRAYAAEDVTEADLNQRLQDLQGCQQPDFTNPGVCPAPSVNG